MRTVFFLILAILVFSCEQKTETSQEKLPNFIHIFADDLGYGDIGCFGATDIKTPNIDRLAAEGIKFTDFYSAAHVCSPSRAALLTGRLPQRMGINQVFFPESWTGMPETEFTIAQQLKKKNYATGVVGKWHLGHREKYLPLQRGFDFYFGVPYSNDMEGLVYIRGNDIESYEVDQKNSTKKFTEEALGFIDRNKDQPFFLYMPYTMPHVPIYASDDFLGTSERGLYGDVIQEIDWSVGEVLKKLEEEGLLENTLVVFSSDNGPWLVMEDHGGSAGQLREGKMFTFEGGMRVPTIAMWKGKIESGQVHSGIATQMDWFPTFSKLADIPTDPNVRLDGEDISDILFNGGKRNSQQFVLYDGMKPDAYRDGDWKVKLPYAGFPGARYKQKVGAHDTLLINLENDPGEANNLYDENKELAKKLIDQMNIQNAQLGPMPGPLSVREAADESHYQYLQSKD